jgi:predicted amidohydrolase YtcJ
MVANWSVKLFVDGSLGARTALMRQPYADDPETRGIQCLTQEQLDALTSTAHENGFQVTVHVIGDGAMEMVLDSYEKNHR